MTDHTALQKALYAIRKLKQLLHEQQQKSSPVAIIGLSCRFPQAMNKDAYWQLLCGGKNTTTPLPEQRWELLTGTREEALRDPAYSYCGSYLTDIDAFDAYFFGITPREAIRMDPQQRFLLEVAYEAIEDAGLEIKNLAGSNTGVFAGVYASQFVHLQESYTDLDALFLPTGNATGIAANRLSYQFNLQGPSVVIDTTCSSSLVALHLACLNLQTHLCDLALVCGAHINLLPSIHQVLLKAKMLSKDGKCRTFDADAKGYGQGEGVGVVVLKSLNKAIEDKDRIYAVIEASAINQDGASNGLTAPNGLQQEALLKSAYATAKIDPQLISYVECHGTGTFLGDPIELQALGEVISKNRNAENPCWIGAVKTNIGHLEPAAGIASVIKTALALQQGKIPPHVNFATPNPHIAFEKYHFRVPQQLEEWPKYGAYRIAGVSGFGFGGTNAHVVMREVLAEEKSAITQQNKPVHSWQHQRYWPDMTSQKNQDKNIPVNGYLLQGKHIASPLLSMQFEFIFSVKQLPEIKDTFNILHVGYYLEMLAFMVQKIYQKAEFTAENVSFLSPLLVSDHAEITVQLIVTKLADDRIEFNFHSCSPQQKNWIEHAKGNLVLQQSIGEEIESITAIKQRCFLKEDDDAYAFYSRISGMGMPTGGSIRWTKKYWLNEKEILCEFHPPELMHKHEEFALKVHPGVIDACVQSFFALLPEQFSQPFVVSHIEKIQYTCPDTPHFYLQASLKTIDAIDGKIVGDWCLINQNNKIVAQCKNLQMSQLESKLQIEQVMRMGSEFHFDSSLPIHEQKQQIMDYLINQIASLFSMPKEDIKIDRSLQRMGMDSLIALALMRVIETGFGVTYSMQDISQDSSIASITEHVVSIKNAPVVSENTKSHELSAPPGNKESNPWIMYRQSKPNAKIRLFCFPYGGGSASIYREWSSLLPSHIEVCPIQLPGREERMNEQPIMNIDTLIDALIKNLQPEFDLPFAFFGHSFGSLIAFALTRYLRKHDMPLPIHLFVSAFPDPKIPTKSLDNLLQQLDAIDIELLNLDSPSLASLSDEKVMQLMAIFNENGLFEYDYHLSPEIIRMLLPVFIGDMRIVKSYYYRDESPFDLPVTVFLGQKDTWVSYADHLGWAAHTRKRCEVHEFNSGHLFIKDSECRGKIFGIITRACPLAL